MTIKQVSEKYNISPDTLRYYEKAGAIPPVTRNASGIRDYQENDLAWIELAKCMRAAGLPIEALTEYLKLFQHGDETIGARLKLLQNQRDILLEQQKQIAITIDKLNYKISIYEQAAQNGTIIWDKNDNNK